MNDDWLADSPANPLYLNARSISGDSFERTDVCGRCGAMVPWPLKQLHDDFHGRVQA